MVRHTRSKVPGHFNYRLALSLSIMAFFMPGPCVHFYYIFLSSLKSGYLGPVCLWSVTFFVLPPTFSLLQRSCNARAWQGLQCGVQISACCYSCPICHVHCRVQISACCYSCQFRQCNVEEIREARKTCNEQLFLGKRVKQ